MKSTILNLNKRVLVVDMPRICDYEVFKHGIYFQFENGDRDFIDGEFDLICKGCELTEEIAGEIILFNENTGLYDGYYSPLVAFTSAIEAKDFWWKNNPFEKPDFMDGSYDNNGFGDVDKRQYKKDLKEWQEAESKTFNPDRTLIFEIL